MSFWLSASRVAVVSTAVVALSAGLALAQSRVDLAIFHAERSPWTPTIEWWIDEIGEATENRVNIVPHYSGALSTLNETLKSVRDGAVPAGLIAAAAVSGQLPYMAYPEALGGLPIDPTAQAEAFAELRPVLESSLREQGVEYLWTQTSGTVLILCRDKHLKTPEDWQGLRIRSAGRWQGEQVLAVGGSPVAIDPSEQYISLQNGTIDCALSVTPIAEPLKLYEVAPKVTSLRLSVNASPFIMNEDAFNGLSAEDQEAVRRVSVEAEQRSADAMAEADEAALKAMEEGGADIYLLSDEELAALTQALSPAFEKIDSEAGEIGQQVKAVLAKYR